MNLPPLRTLNLRFYEQDDIYMIISFYSETICYLFKCL